MVNKFKKSLLISGGLIISLCMNACGLMDMKEQSESIEARSKLSGSVANSATGKSVYVNLYRENENYVELRNQRLLTGSGKYSFSVLPGRYSVGAFVDANGDGEYQQGEPATYHGVENKIPIFVEVKDNVAVDIPNLTISGAIDRVANMELRNDLTKAQQNIGKVISLSDPMFSNDAVSTGMWRPLEFVDTYGGGLMLLQAYDAKKTPVLFVHGIGGSVTSFQSVIDDLNKEKFQPWVLQYPSGMSLDVISDYVIEALDQLQVRHQFNDIIVVAHSMGGLVTRSFVMKHELTPQPYKLRMVMTINSPLYGMDSAISGVEYSPIVVPSWRDVASNSEFVRKLHEWRWPSTVPYYLIFSYLPEKDGDRVVPLKSQLSLSLQEEAIKIFGFEAEHTAILQEPKFIEKFNEVLANYD